MGVPIVRAPRFPSKPQTTVLSHTLAALASRFKYHLLVAISPTAQKDTIEKGENATGQKDTIGGGRENEKCSAGESRILRRPCLFTVGGGVKVPFPRTPVPGNNPSGQAARNMDNPPDPMNMKPAGACKEQCDLPGPPPPPPPKHQVRCELPESSTIQTPLPHTVYGCKIHL